MVTLIYEYTTENHRSVLRSFVGIKAPTKDIYKEVSLIYGG
jgi:hypothetical protein